jgi:hypothetical protein
VLQYKIHKRERTARDLLLVMLADLKNTVDQNLNTADLTLNTADLNLNAVELILYTADLYLNAVLQICT